MKVDRWMKGDPVTATVDTSVTELARLLTDPRRGCVVIVDGDGAPIGIVTRADLLAKHAAVHFPTYFSLLGFSFPVESRRDEREMERALATTARDLMSSNMITIGPAADVDTAATLMLDNSLQSLPVVDGGRLVGVIEDSDIVRLLVVEEAV